MMRASLLPLLGLPLLPVVSAPVLQAPARPVAVVAQLCRDFAWEAVREEPEWRSHGLLEQPRSVLARYFDDSLVSLLLADRECARREGVCRLDRMPIWDSQDPGASQLKVLATADPAAVRVTLRYPSDGTVITLTYRMVRTARGWRVRDILSGGGGSLRERLSAH